MVVHNRTIMEKKEKKGQKKQRKGKRRGVNLLRLDCTFGTKIDFP